jgi:hypothetical protein
VRSMRDPRTSGRYKRLRAEYIARHPIGTACCLCGRPIDTTLSGMSAWGPTVEHHVPIAVIRTAARTWDDLVAMCCDMRTWGIAHRRCQASQGARSTNAIRRAKAGQSRRRPAW